MSEQPWIDRSAYPFTSRWMQIDAGRMHYIDEGKGHALVMVHGTPIWSFVYRNLIRDLARDYRCIAMDHLGFGLSDKPANGAYNPSDLARNLDQLLGRLNLSSMTLIVHDFGGPIGLSYALSHPERVERLVLFNTWMWSLRAKRDAVLMHRLFGGPLGKLLYTRVNISTRLFYKLVWGDRSTLDPAVQQQYIQAVPRPEDRIAQWVCARELINSTDWYEQLWGQRERIKDIPALLLWGMKDPAFDPRQLQRWQALFSDSRTVQFPTSGHFVQEEQPGQAIAAIRAFLADTHAASKLPGGMRAAPAPSLAP